MRKFSALSLINSHDLLSKSQNPEISLYLLKQILLEDLFKLNPIKELAFESKISLEISNQSKLPTSLSILTAQYLTNPNITQETRNLLETTMKIIYLEQEIPSNSTKSTSAAPYKNTRKKAFNNPRFSCDS